MSKEPSMEEILSSIKRIIAEEGDEAAQAVASRSPRRGRAVAEQEDEPVSVIRSAQVDEVLELTDAFDLPEEPVSVEPDAEPAPSYNSEANEMAQSARSPAPAAVPEVDAAASPATMLSVESEVAARHSLSTLSAMLVKPQGSEDNTLEALVRELLRPMMKQWLDANLPDLVEAMVAKEIARITSREL